MTFTSLAFFVFFAVVLALRGWMRSPSKEIGLLLVASYIFCLTSGLYGVLLIALTSSIDFEVGKRIGATQKPSLRQRWLLVSLVTNLGILALFKYTNFILDSVAPGLDALGLPVSPQYAVALPIGISYFTFTGISYTLDVYYERMEPCRSRGAYLLYVAYFPKLLAGPLARAREFLPQLEGGTRVTAADVEVGASYLLVGAIKKVVIADQLANHVSLIFASPGQYDSATLLQGLVGYTVQIYCDFSGYSDMAIGAARLMGVRLPENFLMPYSAVNITEFWRRWHITLSTWFRDYVFLPLELATKDVRSGLLRTSMSLMATMVLCGIWHGAGWNFLIWGAIHGGALAAHRAWRSWRPLRGTDYPFRLLRIVSSRILTLAVVMTAWIFFRTESLSAAGEYIRRLVMWRDGLQLGSAYIVPLSALVLVAHMLFSKDRNWAQEIASHPIPIRVGAYSMLMLWLSLMAVGDSVPFVYLQF